MFFWITFPQNGTFKNTHTDPYLQKNPLYYLKKHFWVWVSFADVQYFMVWLAWKCGTGGCPFCVSLINFCKSVSWIVWNLASVWCPPHCEMGSIHGVWGLMEWGIGFQNFMNLVFRNLHWNSVTGNIRTKNAPTSSEWVMPAQSVST